MKAKAKVVINSKALQETLANKNMSVIELSRRMNVAPSTIYRALDDENPKGVGGETIANMLGALGFDETKFATLFIFTKPLHLGNETNPDKPEEVS